MQTTRDKDHAHCCITTNERTDDLAAAPPLARHIDTFFTPRADLRARRARRRRSRTPLGTGCRR
eukprot:2096839-Prymnesium_polylepis.1